MLSHTTTSVDMTTLALLEISETTARLNRDMQALNTP